MFPGTILRDYTLTLYFGLHLALIRTLNKLASKKQNTKRLSFTYAEPSNNIIWFCIPWHILLNEIYLKYIGHEKITHNYLKMPTIGVIASHKFFATQLFQILPKLLMIRSNPSPHDLNDLNIYICSFASYDDGRNIRKKLSRFLSWTLLYVGEQISQLWLDWIHCAPNQAMSKTL